MEKRTSYTSSPENAGKARLTLLLLSLARSLPSFADACGGSSRIENERKGKKEPKKQKTSCALRVVLLLSHIGRNVVCRYLRRKSASC